MSAILAHRAWVGASDIYDLVGALQFSLAIFCGLREDHYLLDFGCGSLRAGKFFIPYLKPAHYYGIEPNTWLLEQAFQHEIGQDTIKMRQPQFSNVADFTVPFQRQFDYIIAQSIFTHTGKDLLVKLLASLANAINPDGLILATFFLGDTDEVRQGWLYSDSLPKGQSPAAFYRKEYIISTAQEYSLNVKHLSFFHPRNQQWFAFAKTEQRLTQLTSLMQNMTPCCT